MEYVASKISKKELVKLLPKHNIKPEGNAETLRARLIRLLKKESTDDDFLQKPENLNDTLVEHDNQTQPDFLELSIALQASDEEQQQQQQAEQQQPEQQFQQ
uniref:SAP domain-containing protein n=1 Tax=Cacopsylla melanoneura TaxID=428564 RepID=A0A8D8RUR9_9HEMI